MSHPTIVLVGNPNCGKTTLFNALTGKWQQIGNWAGVTVERKSGHFFYHQQSFEIIDLPGAYTLTIIDPQGAQDENITSEYLKSNTNSAILNVVDAINVERNLYLTLQCIEQNHPIVVALNRMDLVEKQGEEIAIDVLAQHLGCPVVSLAARQGKGIEALKTVLAQGVSPASLKITYPALIEEQLIQLKESYEKMSPGKSIPRYQLLRWLEGEPLPCQSTFTVHIQQAVAEIEKQSGQTPDVLIAKARYDLIEQFVSNAKRTVKKVLPEQRLSQRVDHIVCHRYLGFPIFLMMMYALFFFAINMGGAFQGYFEWGAEILFVDGLTQLLTYLNAPFWLKGLLVSGLGVGITTVITFVPVLGAMFFALALLEDSGYMARAAFVVDRLMRAVGLPGKSFVPMIVGFGCNVPAIMGARTLENKRDRILAVMMSPFMSCGARLAIFTVFVAAFFPEGGQNIVFILYLIGIVMAVLTGLLLKKTLLRGEITPLILEMPDYHLPHWRSLWLHCWHRLRRFLFNAGRLIIPVCICIGVLNSISIHGKWLPSPDKSSILSVIGQKVVPIFEPLGIEKENWPAAVGLFTGILAKEVVIGTLNSLYAQEVDQNANVIANVSKNSPYGEMVKRFNGQENAFAYLIFVLLYFPCVSATAAMVREVQKGWTIFSVCWTTGLAYAMAVIYYQCATMISHPVQSILWVVSWLIIGCITIFGIRFYSREYLPRRVPTMIVLR
ncbi:MAG: Fe(2+) transporter permease subunit FeoB [Candidatus Berkiellales bacterium]